MERDRLMRVLRVTCVLVVVITWIVVTGTRVALWSQPTERAIWTDAVAQAPMKPRPRINLGKQYVLDGEEALAADAYETGIRLAQAPTRSREEQIVGRAVGEINLALLSVQAGDRDRALVLASQAAARASSSPTIQRMYLWITREQLVASF